MPASPRSCRVLLAVAVLCAAPAMPATPSQPRPAAEPAERPVLDPSAPTAATPVPAGPQARIEPAPAPNPSADTMRVAIRVPEAAPGTAQLLGTVPGVAHTTTVRIGLLAAGADAEGDRHELTVAAVDLAGYRRFAPQAVADTVGVWDRLAEGAIAVTHEHGQRLGLQLGRDVMFGGSDGVRVRVGAFATNGLPPVAQAIVGSATGARLGLDTVAPTVLVGLEDDVDPQQVAARARDRLGREVTVVPDPRAAPPVAPPQAPQGDTVWDRLAGCESSGNWHVNTGNGYYGGLQFLPESWWLVGGTGMPHEASRAEQILRAERLLAMQGWVAWPACSLKLGLREEPGAS